MIYIFAISLLALTHVIYHSGRSGSGLAMRLEKITVLAAVIASIAAIIELGSFVTSLFESEGDEFSGWLPGILCYPAGLILFLFVVLVVLPKPIAGSTQAAHEAAD